MKVPYVDGEGQHRVITLQDVCFKPQSPTNNNCSILSLLNYFQNIYDRLLNTTYDPFQEVTYNASYHIHFCVRCVFICLYSGITTVFVKPCWALPQAVIPAQYLSSSFQRWPRSFSAVELWRLYNFDRRLYEGLPLKLAAWSESTKKRSSDKLRNVFLRTSPSIPHGDLPLLALTVFLSGFDRWPLTKGGRSVTTEPMGVTPPWLLCSVHL